MEKVLYEYGFDLSEYLFNLIPLIVGIGFFATSISIIKAKKRGEDVPVDAFGHPRLDKVNVGQYVGKRLGELLKAEKVQVFKSGYFARAAAPNKKDLKLIEKCARAAVACALKGESGVVGPDEDNGAVIHACEFPRIKGGKPFNVRKGSFRKMLSEIGQPNPRKKRTAK